VTEPLMLPGGYQVAVVGESYYQENLDRVCGGRTEDGHWYDCWAILCPEPSNPYDPNAVAIYVDDLKVGHLSREAAKTFLPVARHLAGRRAACAATVRGGWDRGGGDQGYYGVVLDLAGVDECVHAIQAAIANGDQPRQGLFGRLLGGQ
jgi:hypothetical protein